MKFLLAKKEYMTQVFDENGEMTAATVLKTGPLSVAQVKTVEKDGYKALKVAFGKSLREIKGEGELESFSVGDNVTLSAVSKGKGFQGVVKRHGFHGGPRSHGQKHSEREPGSIGGAGRDGGRVAKGKRMAGRMGGGRVTVKNLKILSLDGNTLVISGAVPGRRGTLVEIREN